MHVLELLLTLALAPAPAVSNSASAYKDTLAQLAHADASASQHPDQDTAALLEALVELTEFPASVAADPDAQALQSLAQLNLARSYLQLGKLELAGATLDEAIRTAQGRELPVAAFGPSLESIYQARLVAMEAAGRARLRVACTVPCRVFVNEREVPTLSEPMYVGIYRVWIVDRSGKHPPQRGPVQIEGAGGQVELEYRPQPKQALVQPSLPEPATPRSRVLSRNGEIAMMALGVGLASVGTWMIAARGRSTEGPVVIGIGGVSFLIGGALLVVDEAEPANKRRSRAAINWPLRF